MRGRPGLCLALVGAIGVAAGAPMAADATTGPTASWSIQPGPAQLAVLGGEPGDTVGLIPAGDDTPAHIGTVDDAGSVLFRSLDPGRWQLIDADGAPRGEPVEVPSLEEVPAASLYEDQVLPGGFGYLTTRDGTTLSVNVALPGPAEDGPYPTVVEYSGYQPSDPTTIGLAPLFNALGYAYVGVNMRGTGCSGGSFQFFEPIQSLDGYDAVETVAAQPWVLDHRVGMVGVSYPGITQLYVAATRPPSLAAITPLSVYDDAYTGVLYPGGILNTGFAVAWARARTDEAASGGQEWAAERIADGDDTCAANQALRGQNPDLVELIGDHPYRDPDVADPLSPELLVGDIEIPVFVAGAWQDEQTGAGFATMLDAFTGTDQLFVDVVNGLHIESVSAGVFPRYLEFLDLYVARRVPRLAAVNALAPVLAASIFGTDDITLPPDRFEGVTYEAALAWFESEPPVRVLFEEGAADDAPPGAPLPRFVVEADAWPPPAVVAQAWYLGDGALRPGAPPAADGSASYRAQPDALPATFFDPAQGSVWVEDVTWDWRHPPAGTAAEFVTEPFATETVFAGSASADLWIRSSAADTDLEVTLSEIRPDGQEVYVQSGWLRASQRALDDALSTVLRPVPTHREADAAPLTEGEWSLARVEILPFAHALRPGSRLRLTIDAPGNSRAAWVFDTVSDGETVEIAWGPEHPSRLVLPLLPGIDVPDGYPTCTLRGQPCRPAGG
ncbi:MAG: CocE/NonD family hydrolase [Desertimonas sp.]